MLRLVPKSLVRLGLPAVAVLTLALGGCGEPAAPAPSTPPATPAPSSTVAATTGTAGSDGLTVRYLADDGTVRTVGVQDFPR